MSGSRTINRDHVHGSGAFGCIIQTHSFGEVGPGGAVSKRVRMPGVEVARVARWWVACRGNRSGGPEMFDDCIVPIFAVLVAQDDTVSRDRKSTRLNSSHITISYAVFC